MAAWREWKAKMTLKKAKKKPARDCAAFCVSFSLIFPYHDATYDACFAFSCEKTWKIEETEVERRFRQPRPDLSKVFLFCFTCATWSKPWIWNVTLTSTFVSSACGKFFREISFAFSDLCARSEIDFQTCVCRVFCGFDFCSRKRTNFYANSIAKNFCINGSIPLKISISRLTMDKLERRIYLF